MFFGRDFLANIFGQLHAAPAGCAKAMATGAFGGTLADK